MAPRTATKMLSLAALAGTAFGALPDVFRLRTISERVAVGECVDSTSYPADQEYFLKSLRVGLLPSDAVRTTEMNVQAANLISVQYGSNFKVLTEKLAKEQYILTQCGTTAPTDAEISAVAPLQAGYLRKHFTIPLQKVIADGTTGLGFLRRLDVQDRVSHADQYATGPCWQKAQACGAQLEASWGGNATIREAQLNAAEAVFMDCSGECTELRARPNAVHFSATKDNGNLHSAEYIKFVAAFFNLEDKANTLFSASVTAYAAASQQVATRPVVAWIQYSSYDGGFVLSQAAYKTQLTSAAGGTNINGTAFAEAIGSDVTVRASGGGSNYIVPGTGATKSAGAKRLMDALAGVDIVIDETYAPDPVSYNYSSFLSEFSLQSSSSLKFVSNKKVLRFDGTISANKGLDWYESRVASPDWAVEGLAFQMHGDASKRRKYFRNVAKDEVPEVITAAMCVMELPSCNVTAFPQRIEIMAQAPTDTSSASAQAALMGVCAMLALLIL